MRGLRFDPDVRHSRAMRFSFSRLSPLTGDSSLLIVPLSPLPFLLDATNASLSSSSLTHSLDLSSSFSPCIMQAPAPAPAVNLPNGSYWIQYQLCLQRTHEAVDNLRETVAWQEKGRYESDIYINAPSNGELDRLRGLITNAKTAVLASPEWRAYSSVSRNWTQLGRLFPNEQVCHGVACFIQREMVLP
jgi:hypothetical protein